MPSEASIGHRQAAQKGPHGYPPGPSQRSKLASNVIKRQTIRTPIRGKLVVRTRSPDYLPDDLLGRADFAAACESQDLGAIFRLAVKWGGPGFTPSHLARRCEMSVGRVGEYMKDLKQAQSIGVFERVSDALHIPGAMLGISRRQWEQRDDISAESKNNIPAGQKHDSIRTAEELLRDDDLDFLIPGSGRSDTRSRRHDPRMVDALSTVLAAQRRAEDVIGSRAVIEPVRAQLTVIKDLVTDARGDIRSRILDVGSQWSQFAGWLSANSGQLDDANRFYQLALEWASEADEPNMMATALSMQGHTAWLKGQAGPVIGLSQAAQRDKRASPGIRALAVQQEARGMALSREASIDDIDCKFDEAEALATRAAENPDNEPPWIYFFSPDYLLMQRGLAYRLLGHYEEANKLLTEGLASIPAEMRGSEWVASRYLLQLAITYAQTGDIHQACGLAKEAGIIAQHTDSTRLRQDLSRFGALMVKKYPDSSEVADLAEFLSSIGA
jgi:tetratricopeptide (TPR) repeat protein